MGIAARPGYISRLRRVVANGARRRCPRCGIGALFERWNRVLPACSHCALPYLLNQGDPWVFLLILDRGAFILPPIALLYFGWVPGRLGVLLVAFAALIGVLIYTTPHRYGICVGLDVLTRGDDLPQADA